MPDFLSIMPVRPQQKTGFLSTMPVNPSLGSPSGPISPANPAQNQYAGPVFQDILDRLNKQISINPIRGIGGESRFEQGLKTLTPSAGFDPAYQSAIDQIRANAGYYGGRASSQAQALASRRGLAGSSVEQFGTQSALENVNRAAADQEASIRLQELGRRQALQDAQAKALLERSGQEGSLGAQIGATEAGLNADQQKLAANMTSDEIASLRNSYFADQQLKLQALLGQQGIDIARQNIGASEDIARQQAQYGLLGSLGSALIPGLIGGGGGGGGGLGGLFGGGGGGGGLFGGLFGGGGGGLVGAANPGAGGAASSLFPGGLGGVGTGVPAGGGIGLGSLFGGLGLGYLGGQAGQSAFGGGNDLGALAGGGLGFALGGPLGAGVGSFLGTGAQRLGERAYGAAQGAFGNTAASFLKPFTDPVGAVKSVTSKVSSTVNKVFRF